MSYFLVLTSQAFALPALLAPASNIARVAAAIWLMSTTHHALRRTKCGPAPLREVVRGCDIIFNYTAGVAVAIGILTGSAVGGASVLLAGALMAYVFWSRIHYMKRESKVVLHGAIHLGCASALLCV